MSFFFFFLIGFAVLFHIFNCKNELLILMSFLSFLLSF